MDAESCMKQEAKKKVFLRTYLLLVLHKYEA